MPISNVMEGIDITDIEFEYYDNQIKMTLLADNTYEGEKVSIEVSSYELDGDKESYNKFTYNGNTNKYYLTLPNIENKTLFEIEIYRNLYRDSFNTYNFILYATNEVKDNHSYNPIRINLINNISYYEDIDFKNMNEYVEYTLLSKSLLPSSADLKVNNPEVYISIPVENEKEEEGFYPLKSEYKDNRLQINNVYYSFIDRKISYTNGLLLNGVNLPVPSFSLKIILNGVGKSNSRVEILQEYKNTKLLFGNCEEALLCFI